MSAAFEKGRPYSGWMRSLSPIATFDTVNEFRAAAALDGSSDVDWWLRNDPVRFRLPTPAGGYEPDFIYGRVPPGGGNARRGILEIKGEFLWDAPETTAAIKAEAACAWVAHQNDLGGEVRWEFAIVMEDDVPDAPHIDALRAVARRSEP